MNTILRQFVEWGTALKQTRFTRAALILAVAYTSGVFLVLLSSGVAIYYFSTTAIPLPPEIEINGVEYEVPHAEFSLYEFREHLIDVLIIVDLVVLVLAAGASYAFAIRTLRPIEILYRRQERFVGDVAHELRTPLTVLKAGAESMLHKTRTSEEYIQFLGELTEETNRLTRLSNDLLLILKTGQLQHNFSPVLLSEVVLMQIRQLSQYAHQREVRIKSSIDEGVVVVGSADSLTRVVQNLLKNAIDYNKPDGTVTLTLSLSAAGVLLTVADTGIGIAAEHVERIFNRFYKVDRARSEIGNGLGLSIVKEIVEAHEGTIAVKSTLKEGTIFTVRLPRP